MSYCDKIQFRISDRLDINLQAQLLGFVTLHLSRLMRKPTICICETEGPDQLRSTCEADQRLCFHYKDSTIPLLSKSKISSFLSFSVFVQFGLCQTCSKFTCWFSHETAL